MIILKLKHFIVTENITFFNKILMFYFDIINLIAIDVFLKQR